jgi:hypothetical protein
MQGSGELGHLPLGHLGGHDRLRSVERPAPLVQLDRHARLQQAQRVVDSLVAKRIELRGGDVCGRQAGEIGEAEGGASLSPGSVRALGRWRASSPIATTAS